MLEAMSTGSYEYVTFDGFSPFVGQGPYSSEDYWRLPEGEPVELIRGRFVVSPCPVPLHQVILGQLLGVLHGAEDKGAVSLCWRRWMSCLMTATCCSPTCST